MARLESDLWEVIRDAVLGHWERVENLISVGYPDVSFCTVDGIEGHMEIKQLKKWPKRRTTTIDPEVTVEQIRWGALRTAAGGFWLLGIGTVDHDILLFTGLPAARVAGKQYTREQMYEAAAWYGPVSMIEAGIKQIYEEAHL